MRTTPTVSIKFCTLYISLIQHYLHIFLFFIWCIFIRAIFTAAHSHPLHVLYIVCTAPQQIWPDFLCILFFCVQKNEKMHCKRFHMFFFFVLFRFKFSMKLCSETLTNTISINFACPFRDFSKANLNPTNYTHSAHTNI